MPIADVLNRTSVSWHEVKGVRPGWELVDDQERLVLATGREVEVGDRLLRGHPSRGGRTTFVDVATGARVATIRVSSHGPAAISVGQRRYRMSKRGVLRGVLPIFWEVTEDFGGPQIVRYLKLGSTLRVKAGADMDTAPTHDLDLLVALTSMRLLGLLGVQPEGEDDVVDGRDQVAQS